MFLLNDLSKLEPIFKAAHLENIEVIGRLKNIKNAKIWVDDLEQPSAFLYQDDEWTAPFAKTEKGIANLVGQMEERPYFEFCGIPMNIARVVIESLKQKGYALDWEEHCGLYHLPASAYDRYQAEDSQPLGPILETDLETVNHYYTYKGEGSLAYLKQCISANASSMVRDENGAPVSWALIREDGSMGVMYTLKTHRKKGLAKKVSIDLIKKAIQTDLVPYVHIVIGNAPSVALATELGMVKWGEVLWFGLKKVEEVSND